MPAICVFAPAVAASWPAITAAVAGAAAALGMGVAREGSRIAGHAVAEQAVEVGLEQCEVTDEVLATEEQIVLVQDDVRVRIFRDERGKCRALVTGVGRSNAELRAIGEQVVHKITQQLVYNKLMSELRAHAFNVVTEDVEEDGTVRVHVRHWEG